MDLSTLANLINAFAVTAGVIFAAVQIRYYRQQRRREAMLELETTRKLLAVRKSQRALNCQMAQNRRYSSVLSAR
jgi:ribosomal protein L18